MMLLMYMMLMFYLRTLTGTSDNKWPSKPYNTKWWEQYYVCPPYEHELCFLTNFVSESGYLHKAVLLQSGAHIIEEVQVFEQPQPIKSLKLSIPKVHGERDIYFRI